MIVVDTSALIAIVGSEPAATACTVALAAEADGVLMSAATLSEALIVAARRGVQEEVDQLVRRLGITVIALTPLAARQAAEAYRRWGRGFHPAGLNYGDCFAYQLAAERNCPLLYVGEDFARTDIRAAA